MVYGRKFSKKYEGSGMEDVIFWERKSAFENISEVALLDNQEKTGSTQYNNFDEISIKRKIEKIKVPNII